MRSLVGLLVALCLVATSPSVWAKPAARSANPHLDEAKRRHARLQYAEALNELDMALAAAGSNRGQRVECYALMGQVQAILGKDREARLSFGELLRLEPGYQLDAQLSPKILDVFAAAQAERAALPARSPPPPPATASTPPPATAPVTAMATAAEDSVSTAPVSEEETPWYASWGVWAAAGAGVALVTGGVVAAVVLWPREEPKPGSLGEAQLP